MLGRRALATLLGLSALVLTAPAHAASGLAAHWRLDEAGGVTAADSTGHGNDGSILGDAGWISGRLGGALDFDGTTARVRVPASAWLQPQSVTASAWVRHDGSPGGYKYVLAKGASGCVASSYALYSGPHGGLVFYVSGAAGNDYTRSPDAGPGIWDGRWHRVTGTFDGAAVRLYVDGVEVGSGTPRTDPIDYALPTTDDLFLGHYAGCGGLDFPGDIDEPKVFGRALSAAEVAADGYAFSGFFPPVDNPPGVNVAKAGSAIPVKFGLGGLRGMDILAKGSPSSRTVGCDTGTALDAIETVAPAGSSTLTYDSSTQRYHYVWKTPRSWGGSCRRLSLELDDGSEHVATFRFK